LYARYKKTDRASAGAVDVGLLTKLSNYHASSFWHKHVRWPVCSSTHRRRRFITLYDMVGCWHQ